MKKVTIKDVAERAGFSISTVSYALNNKRAIPEETKKLILEVVNELNYLPNHAARNLKNRQVKVIGVFIDSFVGYVYSEILEGICSIANGMNYEIAVFYGEQLSTVLNEDRVDIAIIMYKNPNYEVIHRYSPGVMFSMVGAYCDTTNTLEFMIDNKQAMRHIGNLIVRKNVKNVIYLDGLGSVDASERLETFCETMNKNNIKYDIYKSDFTIRGGNEFIQNHNVSDYQAIICANDEMAIGVIKGAEEIGIKIPDDLYVTGFDGIEVGRLINPSLTSVYVDRIKFGEFVVKKTVEEYENKSSNENKKFTFPITFRKGASCS